MKYNNDTITYYKHTITDYTILSKRLKVLKIKAPRYTRNSKMCGNIAAIALDTTGLKRLGRDEWHVEKHKVSSWRKAHFGIDENHYVQAAVPTDRFTHDDEVVDDLLKQIDRKVEQYTGDGAYHETPIYDKLLAHSPATDTVIPPEKKSGYKFKSQCYAK